MSVLEGINVSTDVQKLNIKELASLSNELRERILSVTNNNGGHLASNLGIIETTVSLYKCFDFSKDKIIFDVGHQCYAYKILSDRKDRFDSIRKDGGISGFPDVSESKYDAFTSGHAGTSIAAGIGYCEARDKLGEDYTVISVVGDAALTNGLNLEALSVKANKPKNFIVLLNDNGMSISKNVNGLYQYLSKGTTNSSYVKSKKLVKKIFGSSFITRWLAGVRNFIKRLVGQTNYFETHGFKYVGVVDGHDVKRLVKMINRVKSMAKDKAVFLHVKTTKGKGFDEAELRADLYHGVGAQLKNECGEFSKELGKTLNELMEKNDKIIAITAGMKDGTGLCTVEKEHPHNFVDVGIAEEYAITSAAGMAAGGLKPVVAIYSTFMQRCYDQIVHDVCLQNLPVVLCMDRAGVVGSDGCTHQGVFDISYLMHVPNIKIFAPTSISEFSKMLEYAISLNCPVAIRYPKNSCVDNKEESFDGESWQTVVEGNKVTILAVGPRMLELALKVKNEINEVRVISARIVKPLDEKTLEYIRGTTIVTLEENSLIGGFGYAVNGYYASTGKFEKVLNFGIQDSFVRHGSVQKQFEDNGLTVHNIISKLNLQ